LGSGWRFHMVGKQLHSLMSGESGLAFDGRGGLRIFPVPPHETAP